MRYYYLIAITFLPQFFSCKGDTKKSSLEILKEVAKRDNINVGKMKFAFQLPKNWVRIDTVLQGLKITLLMQKHSADNFEAKMNVTAESMHNENHKEYFADTKKYLASNGEEVELAGDGGFDVNGNECLWCSYSRSYGASEAHSIFYSIDVNGISYNITGGVLDGGLAQYKPIFDQIVKSFKLRIKMKVN